MAAHPFPFACLCPALPHQLEDELHAERQRATSAAHKASDEAKRLAGQVLELQREAEAQGREVTRLKVGGSGSFHVHPQSSQRRDVRRQQVKICVAWQPGADGLPGTWNPHPWQPTA